VPATLPGRRRAARCRRAVTNRRIPPFGISPHTVEELFSAGAIKVRCHVVDGFENVPQALTMLLDGTNQGKLLARP